MTTWDAAAAAVDYRLRIEAARARLNQALLTAQAQPGTLPPWTELVRDALEVLDAPRRQGRQKRRRVIPDTPQGCDCVKSTGRSRPTSARKNAIPTVMFEALRRGRIAAA